MNAERTQYILDAVELRDGVLVWKPRPASHFTNEAYTKRWNRQYPGRPVKIRAHAGDYARINVGDYYYLTHRVIWLLTYGAWPKGEIDHINGDRQDNRLENLRDVTRSENLRNVPRRSNNKSGCSGVNWSQGKWVASLTVEGRRQHLGSFVSKDAAIAARRSAQTSFGFTHRHGV